MRLRLVSAVLATLVFVGGVHACNIPVFRYALEQWKPDPFELTVLDADVPPLAKIQTPSGHPELDDLHGLWQFSLENSAYGNYYLSIIEIDLLAAARLQAFNPGAQLGILHPQLDAIGTLASALMLAHEAPPIDVLPHLMVRAPFLSADSPPIWAGRLTADTARVILTSPARREMARRLLGGESAVWVLLEGGNKEADDAAAALLEKELTRLQKDLKLPEGIGEPGSKLQLELPLKIQFSILRISRSDPQEKFLVDTLLSSESDLRDDKYREQPMVFPVFGRGRCMLGLLGKGITTKNITRAATYLVAGCTCEKKTENPGFEILLLADWDSLYENRKPEPVLEPFLSDAGPRYGPCIDLCLKILAGARSDSVMYAITTTAGSIPEAIPVPGPPPKVLHDDPGRLVAPPDESSSPPTATILQSNDVRLYVLLGGGGAVLLVLGSIVIMTRSKGAAGN